MPPSDAPKDRLVALLAQSPATLNGIDFVEVADDAQTTLNVHFLRPVPDLTGSIPATAVTIRGGETIPTVAVQSAAPLVIGGKSLLRLTVAAPGDFSFYTLKITDPRL